MIHKSIGLTAAFSFVLLVCTPLFAARILVDDFNLGPAEIIRWGNPPYGSPQDTYYSVAGPIGGIRQVHVIDANTGTLANPNATSVNTTYGTVEWWGSASGPINWVSYGTAASGGGGTALGLSKLLTDGFLIDIPHSTDLTNAGRPDGTFNITLNIAAAGGGGTVSWSSAGHEFAGTRAVRLSQFNGGAMTALQAANIAGITIQGTGNYITNIASVVTPFPTSRGRGLAVNHVEIAPILTSTGNGAWGTAATWSTSRATVADDYVEVNNTVTVATAGEVAQDVSLTQAGSNLTVNAGASLSASGTVWVNTGSLSATSGGLTAGTLKVTGGTASVGGGGLLGAVNASAGTTNLGTNVTTAINISGTAAVNLTAPISAASATISQLGGSMNTGGNFLSLSNQLKLGDTNSITTTGSFGVKGAALSTSLAAIQTLQLGGGTTTVKQQVPNAIALVNSFPVFTGGGNTNQVINVSVGSKVLVVEIGGRGGTAGPSPPLVTLNGSPLTLATQADFATNLNYTGSTIWYGYNPTPGLNTLTVFKPSLAYNGAAFTLSNVDTTISPEKTWVLSDGANSGTGGFLVPSTLQSNRLDNLLAGSAIAASYTYRHGTGTPVVTWTNTSGVRSNLFTSSIAGQIYTDGELILGTTAGSTTITGTGGPNIRQHLVAAAFNPTLTDGTISMGTTDIEVFASSILDLGGAPSAIFGDLIPTGPVGETLHIQGSVFAAVNNLANFWDLIAPHASDWNISGTDGSTFVELTFGSAVPEPSTYALGLIGLAGLGFVALRKKFRRA